MAHADYDCCAICDCKIEYNPYDAQTKQEICSECLENLKENDINITTVEEFRKVILDMKYDKAKELLIKIGYEFCIFYNELDKEIFYRFFSTHETFEKIYEYQEQIKKMNRKEVEDD